MTQLLGSKIQVKFGYSTFNRVGRKQHNSSSEFQAHDGMKVLFVFVATAVTSAASGVYVPPETREWKDDEPTILAVKQAANCKYFLQCLQSFAVICQIDIITNNHHDR